MTEILEKTAPPMTMAARLLDWYDENRRILPWREDPSPYHVWLSEIMLQQTRVDTVIGYYNRFIEAMPDIRALAEADEDRVLKLWQGLGYYSRARNLRKAARAVVDDYGGDMPDTAEQLQRLPGIGPYVAAAVASIAFGRKEPAVDGNLLRIFARVTLWDQSIRTAPAKRAAADYYLILLPESRPGDMNQALMDLGAGICLPNGTPLCGQCPWSPYCLAHAEHREQALPVRDAKKSRRVERRTILRIRVGKRYVIRQRPANALLANLYEFPNESGWLSETEAAEAVRQMGFRIVSTPAPLPASKHIFSHLEWHMRGYEMEAVPVSSAPAESLSALDPLSFKGASDMAADSDRPATSEIWESAGSGPTSSSLDPPRDNDYLLATPEEIESEYAMPTAFAAYRVDSASASGIRPAEKSAETIKKGKRADGRWH